jgi:acetate kinase
MARDVLLTFNAGSSSLKIGVFKVRDGSAHSAGRLKVDLETKPLRLTGTLADHTVDEPVAGHETELGDVIDDVLRYVLKQAGSSLFAVAHRVVHGGMSFTKPALLDKGTIDRIEALVPLAPLHQPQSLRVIRAVEALHSGVPQTASFDTAFHASQPDLVRRLAIPRAMHDDGVRRYGFHGISYRFIARRLREIAPDVANARTVAAHLGSGSSICAMLDGVSQDTSMGFSALDGIPMATRPGWLDPGVLIYLMRTGMRQPERIEQFLYHECGLLGVSGISGDTRTLLKDARPEAAEAIELYCLRIAGEIARQTATVGGLDALVFTAGIGENQPEIRRGVSQRLRWLGVELDDAANAANTRVVSAAGSRVKVFVIPTDEERIIADEALGIVLPHKAEGGER